jgi:[ribosomal protein S5]-alanine N-acetyltransferase
MTELDNLMTRRFTLRPLREADVSETYLSCMTNVKEDLYIDSISSSHTLETLRGYVRSKSSLENCLFFGIFLKNERTHIGNIKYENISAKLDGAVMGVLVFETKHRGIGVFAEVFEMSSKYISETYGVKRIFLGVREKNLAAIRAYEKYGFVKTTPTAMELDHFGDVSMVKVIVD